MVGFRLRVSVLISSDLEQPVLPLEGKVQGAEHGASGMKSREWGNRSIV